ncbi:MAG: O-antigen ligase family protein [Planctomycetes bacterium]|nr:O-antigen ligase family protein [Planctomycetota bacterium]
MSRLRLAAFFVIIGILAARPLMSETFEYVRVSFIEDSGTGPTPAATMWMDALLLAASAIALSRVDRWTRTVRIAAAAIGLLLAAVIVSSFFADNKRLALNAGASLLIGFVAAAALIRLMTARWMVSVAVAAMLATGAATAFKSMSWHWSEFDQTRRDWQTKKTQLIAEGVDVESGILQNFERRLESGESSGYLSHPNIAGSLLMMWLLPAASLLIAWLVRAVRRRERETTESVIILTVLCGVLAIGLWFTGSGGAFVGAIAGAAMLGMLALAGKWIARRPGTILAVLAGGYLAVIGAAAAYGTFKGTLPHPSLAFRWHYWTAAASAIREAPLSGVGRENFAAAYMQYKPAESPEEVRNPHNLWVSVQAELGLFGLIAIGTLVFAWAYAALRRQGHGVAPTGGGREIPNAYMVATILALCVAHGLFARMGISNPYILLRYWMLEIVLIWAVVFTCAARVIHARPEHDRWLRAGLVAAVVAALVHGLVGFAIFTPAGLGVVAVLAAAAICPLRVAADAGKLRFVHAAAAPMVIAVVAHLLLIVAPTTRTEVAMAGLRRAVGSGGGGAARVLATTEVIVTGDPWDSSSLRQLAEIAARQIVPSAPMSAAQREQLLLRARTIATRAVERSPGAVANWGVLARINEQLGGWFRSLERHDDALAALRAAIRCRQESVRLYPTSARRRIGFAKLLSLLWSETGEEDAGRSSITQYETALELNDRLNEVEVMRLSEKELASIHAQLDRLRDGTIGDGESP